MRNCFGKLLMFRASFMLIFILTLETVDFGTVFYVIGHKT